MVYLQGCFTGSCKLGFWARFLPFFSFCYTSSLSFTNPFTYLYEGRHNKKEKDTLETAMKKLVTFLLAFGICATASVAQGALEKGINAEKKGLDDLAEQYYKEAADTNAEARLHLGLIAEKREHIGDAAKWFSSVDSNAVAKAHLSYCFTELQQWPEAKQAAEKSIELADSADGTTRAIAMGTLALVNCQKENYTNALHWAHQAAKEDPSSARIQNVIGVIYYRRGNDNEAMAAFREALKKDPNNVDAHFNLGSMYCFRGNYDMAVTTIRRGLKENRRSAKLFYIFGWAYLLKGDKDRAIECLQNVLQIDSGYVNAYNRLGDIYHERADYNHAIEQYRHAVQIAPHLPEAYRLMGRTYAEQGDFAKSIRNYQKAVEKNPNDGETYCRIAELYGQQNRPKQEQANYKRAARLGNEKARQWCTRHGITYQ